MKRIPRPTGTTEIAYNHHKEKNDDTLNKLQIHIINHYINTGFMYCNQTMDLDTFIGCFGLPRFLVMERVTQLGKQGYEMLEPEQQGDQLRALLFLLQNESLADRSRALLQYRTLAKSQQGEYKPFISSEVNKALKLTLESTQGLRELVKVLSGSQSPTVVINNNPNQSTNVQQNYLTTEQALELMNQKDESHRKTLSLKERETLYEHHRLEDTPTVQASLQQGVDTSKEGLGIKNLAKVSDKLLNDSHIDRRAHEIDEDLDADHI